MTEGFPDLTELRTLLHALCEETITAEQVRRLEELVLSHPEAEAYYVQSMSLHADLARHFAGQPGSAEQSLRDRLDAGRAARRESAAPAADPRQPTRVTRWSRLLLWGALGLSSLAAALLLALAPWKRPNAVTTPADLAAEETDNTVAVLLQAPGAVWDTSGPAPRIGAPLAPGWLRLKSGFAHLEFYSGATVILQGPAELQLVSRMGAYCARGKLRATVPSTAQGFKVSSPTMDLVDRGTEFGLEVNGDDDTEVHVFQGKVELFDAGSKHEDAPHKELTTGHGVRLDGHGTVNPIKPNPAAFRTAQDLARSTADTVRRRQQAWAKASEALRADPSLLVYYPFRAGEPWSRTLRDEAGNRRQPHDGAIVGCSWATGRWPGKQGLEFKQVSDRVRLHVPGELDALTLAAWVRVDALPNRFNSLMMTDGWEEGAPHWHIGQAGKIELGVQGPNKKNGAHYETPEIFPPDRLGQWVHLAVVYDRVAGQVCHYVDGQPVHQEPVKFDTALRIGDAEIGNWNTASFRGKYPVRYFSGCMDEFMLFSRAFTDAEVEGLYARGRPPS